MVTYVDNNPATGGGGSYDRVKDIDWNGGSSSIASGDEAQLGEEELADGETLEVTKAKMSAIAAQPAASSVTLEIVTFDGSGGYTTQSTIFTGDGATLFESDGSPLASYTNSTGSAQSAGVLIANANASAQPAYGEAKGKIA